MSKKSVLIKNLTFAYPGCDPVLKDLSFSLEPNEVVAILGANGSGKSTLLKIISGQLNNHTGTVLVNGNPAADQNILTCSQNAAQSLFPEMSIIQHFFLWENINTFTVRKGAHTAYAQSVREYLKNFHKALTNLNTCPQNLSGGQQQLLLLALILRKNPPLLLLDEHTSALDPLSSQKILEKVAKTSKEQNLATLFITHNLCDLKYVTRYIVIKNGSILIDSPSDTPPSQDQLSAIYHP